MGTDSSAQQSKRHGFSLVESAIVLGVVGLVLGGIWVAAGSLQHRLRVKQLEENTLLIVQRMKKLWHGQQIPAASIDVTDAMISAGIVPSDYLQNGIITTPFPFPSLSAHDARIVVKNNSEMELDWFGLGISDCIDMMMFLSSKYSQYGIRRIRPGTDVYGVGLLTLPVTIATAKTGCTSGWNLTMNGGGYSVIGIIFTIN